MCFLLFSLCSGFLETLETKETSLHISYIYLDSCTSRCSGGYGCDYFISHIPKYVSFVSNYKIPSYCSRKSKKHGMFLSVSNVS